MDRKRIVRTILRLAFAVAVVVAVVFCATVPFRHLDEWGGVAYGWVNWTTGTEDVTVFAEGYSDTAFRKLHFGMAQGEVERILGKPIAVRRIDENISVEFHGGDLWPPDNNHARETRKTLVWEYSLPRFADRDSVLYRRRSVIFDFPNGHDARIHGIRTGVSPWETIPERRPMEDGDTPCSFLFNGFWL